MKLKKKLETEKKSKAESTAHDGDASRNTKDTENGNRIDENDEKVKIFQIRNNDKLKVALQQSEEKFKRTKSTKSTKSLTLPLDPLKRKDSSSSSCDLSKVSEGEDDILSVLLLLGPGVHTDQGSLHAEDQDDWRRVPSRVRVRGLGGGGHHQANPHLDLSSSHLRNSLRRGLHVHPETEMGLPELHLLLLHNSLYYRVRRLCSEEQRSGGG